MMIESSNPFIKCTTKDEFINLYINQLEELKSTLKRNYGIESKEFHDVLYCELKSEYRAPPILNAINKKQRHKRNAYYYQSQDVCTKECFTNLFQIQLKQYSICIAFIIIIAILLVTYSEIELTKLFMRNIQIFIYPGMRVWRIVTLPIIRTFPELSKFYDETCLISSPFFRVNDLDCSPCADIVNVVDLSNATTHMDYLDNNMPHIVKQGDDESSNVAIAQMYQLYRQNRKVFQIDAYKVFSTDWRIVNLDNLFDVLLNESGTSKLKPSHNLWKINRMAPARILRTIFPQPKTLPLHSGIDIERYIAIDIGGGVTYQLPSTDCSNMFVHQVIGSRTIHLQPTSECKHQCRPLSVRLKQNQILFYDWWYYKPISANQFTKMISVSYIGSYC